MTIGPRLFGVPSVAICAPTTFRRVLLIDAKEGCVCGRGVHWKTGDTLVPPSSGITLQAGMTHKEWAGYPKLEVRMRHRA